VAESSLTIPGVTAVIDCGLARVAGYDPERERNTLYLGRISMQNAIQRAGRAGRLQPGVCIRLWSRADEGAMAPAVEPEVGRLDLAGTMLSLCNLQARIDRAGTGNRAVPSSIRFLTPPPVNRWDKAAGELRRCGAIAGSETGRGKENCETDSSLFSLTKLGAAMSRLPLEPAVAAVLLRSPGRQVREIAIAMAALWESGDSKLTESSDLFEGAQDFIGGAPERSGRGHGNEVRETCTQIRRLLGSAIDEPSGEPLPGSNLRREATVPWLSVFSHRVGVRREQGMVYEFADGRSARFRPRTTAGEPVLPDLLLALSIHEQAGRDTAKKVVIPLYLPLEEEWIAREFKGELCQSVECIWDEARQAVRVEEVTRFRELVLRRREAVSSDGIGETAAGILAEHLADCWDWRREEPEAVRFVLRARLVGTAFPDRKIPEFSPDDWRLVYHGLCEGKYSLAEVRRDSMLRAIKAYIGPALAHFIEKKAPESVILPSGKKGRIGYAENGPPELSARLGDLIGYPAHFTLADGRVKGIFDILAPNYRTVQRTPDLGSFWKNTYPAIKRELQRKYPKHPWP
jgi:ATP-dependent helicase HrpB